MGAGAGAGRWGGRIGVRVGVGVVGGGGCGCGREKCIKDGVDGTEDVELDNASPGVSFCYPCFAGVSQLVLPWS